MIASNEQRTSTVKLLLF